MENGIPQFGPIMDSSVIHFSFILKSMSSENPETTLSEEIPSVDSSREQLKKKRMDELRKLKEQYEKGMHSK